MAARDSRLAARKVLERGHSVGIAGYAENTGIQDSNALNIRQQQQQRQQEKERQTGMATASGVRGQAKERGTARERTRLQLLRANHWTATGARMDLHQMVGTDLGGTRTQESQGMA